MFLDGVRDIFTLGAAFDPDPDRLAAIKSRLEAHGAVRGVGFSMVLGNESAVGACGLGEAGEQEGVYSFTHIWHCPP